MRLLSTFILYFSVVGIVKSTVDYLQHPVKSCHVGDVVENECNKCLCTSKAVFECTSLNCSSQSSHKELEETEPLCFSNQLYVKNLITCICTKDGRWPHKSCHDTFQSLPPRTVITRKCKPNTYIPIDCNVCRCGPDGEILNDRCTRNACEDELNRRYLATSNLYSKCEEKYWYSLAPCQFCFCANQNKLVCNTGNYYNRNLDLGSYKLNVCGKDLIKEAIELIPDNLRTLRMSSDVTNTSTATKTTKKPLTKTPNKSENHVMEINLNTENNTSQSNTSNEHYFVESEAKQQKKQSGPEPTIAPTLAPALAPTLAPTPGPNFMTTTDSVRSTQIPYDDNDMTAESADITLENLKVNTIEDLDVKTIEENDDESVELGVQFDQKPTIQPTLRVATTENIMKQKVYKYDGHTLNIDVPRALKKVFQLALRKSMVALSRTTACTPGATTVRGCNMCFCLKNSKLLCTTDKCSGRNKA